jgi:hypothetical protein
MTENKRVSCEVVEANYFKGSGWIPYTPVMGGGTMPPSAVRSFRYRIIDSTMHVYFQISHSSNVGGVSTTDYQFSYPAGVFARVQTFFAPLASGAFHAAGATKEYIGNIQPKGATFICRLVDPTYPTPNCVVWGSNADSEIRWTSPTPFTVCGSFSVEIDQTAAVLSQTK